MLYPIFQAISNLYYHHHPSLWILSGALCRIYNPGLGIRVALEQGQLVRPICSNSKQRGQDSKQFYLYIQYHSPLVIEKNICEACIYYTHVAKINAKVTSIFKWLSKPLHYNLDMTCSWEVPEGVRGDWKPLPCIISQWVCVENMSMAKLHKNVYFLHLLSLSILCFLCMWNPKSDSLMVHMLVQFPISICVLLIQ